MVRFSSTASQTRITTRTTSSQGEGTKSMQTSRAVWVGRVIFLGSLMLVAAALGLAAYYLITLGETALAESQFESIADRALDSAWEITLRKRQGTISMASIASNAFPSASQWPFVALDGYETVSTNLIETSSGREMGFCPLVTPEQLEDFETFAYNYYERDRIPPFPEGTAVSSFGKGVWGKNPELNTTDQRYHESDGSTTWGSPKKIFAPIIQHNMGAFPALMLNLHFQETRGTVIDYMIDCAKSRAMLAEQDTESVLECGAITDMLILTSQEVEPGPGALIMEPIYPAHNATQLTGLIASSIVWDEVLENVFADEVSGIDCVLQTEQQVHTYTVKEGVAFYKQEGDFHSSKYDEYKRTIRLTGEGLFSSASANYTLSLYPSEEFFEVYSTDNPLIAAIGAVCIIVFTSCVFILYDFYVRKEFNAKKELLAARRKFVRFVSHEVRTPLNSVVMGLSLMREEIASAVGTEDKGLVIKKEINKESAQEWLDLVQDVHISARNSVEVLNDILNYDKIDHDALSLEYTVINIWSLVERTCGEFKIPTSKKKIDFKIDFNSLRPGPECAEDGGPSKRQFGSRDLPEDVLSHNAVGDSVRLTQVLRNLLSNAMKFTPEGGKMLVRIQWDKEGSVVYDKKAKGRKGQSSFTLKSGESLSCDSGGIIQVDVIDSGAGMSEEQQAKLFSEGVQFNVNELQGGQGSGLGLYISKGIIEQHEGTLEASSDGLNQGTTFTMRLPIYHTPAQESKSSALNKGDSDEDVGPLKILIVDDSATNRKLLKRMLNNRGHVCSEAENGSIAVEQVAKAMEEGTTFDTILLDYEMPVLNGPDACVEIRKLGCDSFVVGITGNVLAEDVDFFRQCGANGVLPKPFNLPELEQLWVEYGVNGHHFA